jgi:cystathionine beta-lyase
MAVPLGRRVCDLAAISRLAHERDQGILVAVDNTMMSPYLQRPLELGADIVYHSGTKYLSGHHDLMAGVIGVAAEDLANVCDPAYGRYVLVSAVRKCASLMSSLSVAAALQKVYFAINATGVGLGPFECWLLLRGVKTLGVRMDRQQANAMRLADWLVDKGLKVQAAMA